MAHVRLWGWQSVHAERRERTCTCVCDFWAADLGQLGIGLCLLTSRSMLPCNVVSAHVYALAEIGSRPLCDADMHRHIVAEPKGVVVLAPSPAELCCFLIGVTGAQECLAGGLVQGQQVLMEHPDVTASIPCRQVSYLTRSEVASACAAMGTYLSDIETCGARWPQSVHGQRKLAQLWKHCFVSKKPLPRSARRIWRVQGQQEGVQLWKHRAVSQEPPTQRASHLAGPGAAGARAAVEASHGVTGTSPMQRASHLAGPGTAGTRAAPGRTAAAQPMLACS